jgi:UDPglucose 6-dehydrogenase
MAALGQADACVLVTEWSEFLKLDWSEARRRMARPVVIDGRNALDADELVQLGFIYEGVGTQPRA